MKHFKNVKLNRDALDHISDQVLNAAMVILGSAEVAKSKGGKSCDVEFDMITRSVHKISKVIRDLEINVED